jgi:hypothetical protein
LTYGLWQADPGQVLLSWVDFSYISPLERT